MYLDPKGWHVAQFNLAQLMYPLEDPAMADFVARLDDINALADRSPGFVWRLQDDHGNATALRPLGEGWLVDMSVWESIEAVEAFTYRSEHVNVMRERKRWFEMPKEAHLVLWWVPANHRPEVVEAKARLDHLRRHGPTSYAFNFQAPFRPIQAAG